MKPSLLALLISATFLCPVSAADIDANSKIDAVTVYPQGAEVTRMATVEISAGDHMLVLDNLPGDIDAQSIRVEGNAGAAVEIGSVDSRLIHVSDDARVAGRRKQLENEIATFGDEAARLDQLIQNSGYQRQLIQDLARRPFITKKSSETELQLDSAELGNLFDLVADRLQRLDSRMLDARIRTRKINQQIATLQNKLTELAPRQTVKAVVNVHLSSAAATSGTFRIRYRISNAGWRPFYDARLRVPQSETAGDPVLELVRRAEIVQHTTESWNDVALTLSTARPLGATTAPELQAFGLGFWHKRMGAKNEERESLFKDSANKLAAEAPSSAYLVVGGKVDEIQQTTEQKQADVMVAGFQALYAIPGRVTVDNQGTAKKVQISTETTGASLSAHAAPVLDPNAYLTAKFTIDGETPLLPGRVLLFRDNVFMGTGAMPLLSPGEDHSLGFGVDDRIRIKRTEVRSETSESGIISTDIVQENSWVTEVENLHVRAMPVKIYDRMPFATHEDITVEMLRGSTLPTKRDVDHKRGVMAWHFDLAQGAKQTINFGYRVTSPKDRPVLLGMR